MDYKKKYTDFLMYIPQRGKFNNNCMFDHRHPAPVYTTYGPSVFKWPPI